MHFSQNDWWDIKINSSCVESLASYEKKNNYSQIEKEALGITFAVSKFLRYIYGQHFTLQTDHKPLLTIFGSKKVFLPIQPVDCRMEHSPVELQAQNRVPTIEKIRPCGRIVKTNSQVQRATGN